MFPKNLHLHRYHIQVALSVCVLVFIILSVTTFNAKRVTVKLEKSDIAIDIAETKVRKVKHLTTIHMNKSPEWVTTNEAKKYTKKVFIPPQTMTDRKNVNPEIIKHVNLGPDEARDEFVNLHAYNYTISSNKCSSGEIFLVMLVHSAPANYKKRSLVRSTYGSVKQYKNKSIELIFLLGAVKSEPLQEELKEESEVFGDIVQGTFEDSYRALVKKHVMAMHWYNTYCKSDYILKLDDDTFLNPYRLIDFLTKEKPSDGMWCQPAKGHSPIRNPRSKYHTPVSQYPFKRLPQFCPGFAYITTPDTWYKLYTQSETTRVMNMDDVYVGILALRARVPIFGMRNLLFHCKGNGVGQDFSQLKRKVLFVDKWTNCGTKPFAYWNQLIGSENRGNDTRQR